MLGRNNYLISNIFTNIISKIFIFKSKSVFCVPYIATEKT